MAQFVHRPSVETTHTLAVSIQAICILCIFLMAADIATRCLHIKAHIFPVVMASVSNSDIDPIDQSPNGSNAATTGASTIGTGHPELRQDGLSVNVMELWILLVAGGLAAIAKWEHARVERSLHALKPGAYGDLPDRKLAMARADISLTLLAVALGGYMLFTGVDRFLEMHSRMDNEIMLAATTLTKVNDVNVNVDSLRTQFVDSMKTIGVSESDARRQFDVLKDHMNVLSARAISRIGTKIDGMSITLAEMSKEAHGSGDTERELDSIKGTLRVLYGSLHRIEANLGTEPAVPGR